MRLIPPIKEPIYTGGVLNRVWIRFFQMLTDTGNQSIDNSSLETMQDTPRDHSQAMNEMSLLSALGDTPRDYSGLLAEVEAMRQFEGAGLDVTRSLVDMELQQIMQTAPNPTWESRIKAIEDALESWPVGSVFASVVSTNPATLLGYGTWQQIAEGQMLVGYKSGDADFGTVEGTGGSKTASHDANHTVTQPTAHSDHATSDIQVGTGATVTVVTGKGHDNNHSGTDVAAHSDHNILNPYFTVYLFKRTA